MLSPPYSASPLARVCFQWPRLGPYHIARLEATRTRLEDEGVCVAALETAGRDATYAWRETRRQTAIEHVRLFPSASFEGLPTLAIYRAVNQALTQLDPHAVAINSYSAPDARAALEWCRRHRRTAVLMMESKQDDTRRFPTLEWAKAHIVRAFDAALAGGTPQVEYLTALGFPPTLVFQPYDVVDNAFFARGADAARAHPESTRHLPGLESDIPFFLASNRFIARKNLPMLLRAYHAYRQAAAALPWRLLLLGDGPQRTEFEALVSTLGLEGVTFCGFRQVEELPAYYGRASAFVHPAIVEQWGLVINEAMAAGLPVLASRTVGAARDLVIDEQTGFQFDPYETSQLADQMLTVATLPDDRRLAMGNAARERVGAWSPEAFAEGIWAAVQAGASRRQRPFSPVAQGVLHALRLAATRPNSFHRIRE